MLPGISMYYFTFDCLLVQNVAWNQYVLFYFWVFDGTECCLESVCIVLLLSVWWYRMLPGISMYYFTFECLMVQNVAWNQYVLYYFTFDSSLFDGTECCLESVCIILLLSVWWYRMLPGISMYYFTFDCLIWYRMLPGISMYYFTFDCLLYRIILLLSVWWYRMLPGISMYYFTFECLMVQNVAWNQYVLFYFWVFDGTECCLESVCIIVLLTVWWYRMLPGISMYYCTFDCLLVQNVAWNQYVLLYFWLFMVQNVAWNQYVLFYFWLFTGTECCLESVCIILLLSVWWYRMLPGISMYYFTFDCLLVQNVAWNQYVLFYFWLFTYFWYRMLPGISMYYFTFDSSLFDGTECCLESVCIILILSVWWYRMLPGISMYYFTFDCLLVQNVAWNQYVLFYFWVFDGTECCLESVCIVLLLSVWWYRMLPGISMYYFTFECLLVQNVAWNQYVLFYFWLFDGTECCLESVCIILILSVWWYRMLPGYFTFECLMYRMLPGISMYTGTECCLESVCIKLLLSVWW